MTEFDIYECFASVDENGKALDEFGNEFRDADGQVVIVPVEDRHLFTLVVGV